MIVLLLSSASLGEEKLGKIIKHENQEYLCYNHEERVDILEALARCKVLEDHPIVIKPSRAPFWFGFGLGVILGGSTVYLIRGF